MPLHKCVCVCVCVYIYIYIYMHVSFIVRSARINHMSGRPCVAVFPRTASSGIVEIC